MIGTAGKPQQFVELTQRCQKSGLGLYHDLATRNSTTKIKLTCYRKFSLNTRRLSIKPQRNLCNWSVCDATVAVTPKEQSKQVQFTKVELGCSSPLGPSPTPAGVNFALFSQHSKSVTLCLFGLNGDQSDETQIPMNRGNDSVWHVEVIGLAQKNVLYGYRVDGEGGWDTGGRWDRSKVLLDPYAPLVAGRKKWAQRDKFEKFQLKIGSQFYGTYDFESPQFDWEDEPEIRPPIKADNIIIYEMATHSFTASETCDLSDPNARGTYIGIKEKAQYLKSLGITAVELLPVFEYDELEFQRSRNPREHMVNIWGYSHITFMAPMSRFAAGNKDKGPSAAAIEFKEMVKELHRNGILVIIDVVYNHTAEGGDDDPYLLSMRGIDNEVYYQRDKNAYVQLLNFSGCGNTVNANNSVVKDLILDSLRHWVQEYHVDGFRFDLASCLCRGSNGEPLPDPPVIRAISKDPILSKCLLIAEPWDIGMYQVGSFPNWDLWYEWNGQFRDIVRRFIRGDTGIKGEFATRLMGSADLYRKNNRKPIHSLNFVIAHDGFTLRDLVSYNEKKNENNGEQGKDGTNDNFSWNCGVEGHSDDPGVEFFRQKQMRNLLVALLVAQGTPMLLSGDEYGSTRYGNNNWYGHDSSLTHFDWNQLDKNKELFRFTSEMIKFRLEHSLLGRGEWLNDGDVTWHEDNWDNLDSKFLAFSTYGQGGQGLFVAFNAHDYSILFGLPSPPSGRKWCRVVDTNLPSPRDITPQGNAGVDSKYDIQAYSSIVLMLKDV
eukprot:TRINITY_DN6421_c0_g3_i1.p1 TRINITY_DN6421_c0_g3~~TRINITY_DN6421_c0_g3_i1.p1  ORF type:complete len:798 (-),score=59.59 TRINITY_DN6421_c0_g3_i1:187-2499(-)